MFRSMKVVGYLVVFFPILLMGLLYWLGRRDRNRTSGAGRYAARAVLVLTVLVTGVYGFIAGLGLAYDGDLPIGGSLGLFFLWGVIWAVAGVILVLALWRLAHRKPQAKPRPDQRPRSRSEGVETSGAADPDRGRDLRSRRRPRWGAPPVLGRFRSQRLQGTRPAAFDAE